MIPDESTMVQPRVLPPAGRGNARVARTRENRDLIRQYQPWLSRLGIAGLLVVAGAIGVRIADATGIRAEVLANLADACSGPAGASSLLKQQPAVSMKSRGSVAVCEKLVHLRPQDASARVMLGNAYAGSGRTEEAIASFREALALDANCFDAHLGAGKAHFTRGDYPAAAAAYREALRLRPGSADAHLSLGLALSNAGNFEEAMQAFQKAKELNPAMVQTQVRMGNDYLQAGMCAQAIEYLNSAVQTDQNNPQAHYNLGRAYLRVGDKSLAMQQQQMLQTLDPGLANQLLALINQ